MLGKFKFYIILIIILSSIYPIVYRMSEDIIEINIKEKERITTGDINNIDNKFIVYTKDEVFENTDSWIYFKFNSTDYQNQLKIDTTYKVKVVGWRIPFLSTYRNIIEIK